MNLGSELLNLRRNKISTVATLLSGIERLDSAQSETVRLTRQFALNDLGDAVLANVAVYAAESYWGNEPLRTARRSNPASRRRNRPLDSTASSYQRRLFA